MPGCLKPTACPRAVRPIALLLLGYLVLVGSPAASAADKEADVAASGSITTKDPEITLEDLALMLEPMTKAEVEAKEWFGLLRNKVRENSVAELAVNRKNREIAQLKKQEVAAKELAKATTEVKAKQETEASEQEKAAAAEHLAQAQKKLAKTVDTANKVAAKDAEKVEATAGAGAELGAAGAPTAAASNDQEVLRRAVVTAQKQSEKTGDEAKVQKTAAVAEQEASATNDVSQSRRKRRRSRRLPSRRRRPRLPHHPRQLLRHRRRHKPWPPRPRLQAP
jgi:hypothetical protein